MAELHHIALGARDVRAVANFYASAFSLRVAREHQDERGELRSIWLELGNALLMIERTDRASDLVEGVGAGPFLLAFSVPKNERLDAEKRLAQLGAAIESRSDFTSYARDPEGNRVAISHFPSKAG